VKFLNGRINRAKDVVRSYKNEMRELDKTVSEPYAKVKKTLATFYILFLTVHSSIYLESQTICGEYQ
jgi:hypothetical protein